jgi:hypothetical protein
MIRDELRESGYDQEEDYFKRKEREQLEKLREKARGKPEPQEEKTPGQADG